MKTKLIIISLTLILAGHANSVLASEITGVLSTGLTGTVNETLTGIVVTPPAPVVVPPVSSGGGGGGYYSPILASAVPPTATSTLLAIPQVLGASTYRFTKTLRLGSSGNDVKELQEKLRTEGFFTHPVSTGYFGTITEKAVKDFQKARFLKVSGLVNASTRKILNFSTADYETYRGLILKLLELQLEIAKLA
ncbi:MAG: peptidoglycan-binding domain-containing protein [Candidatus Paceibacterota bacterium]|jgi:hypothetical protein